jgi:hypothetical protein
LFADSAAEVVLQILVAGPRVSHQALASSCLCFDIERLLAYL